MTGLAKIGSKMAKGLMRCKPVAKVTAKLSRNKPEILAVSGGVLIIAAFGWAIYEAVGLKDVLNETSDAVKAVEDGYSEKLQGEMEDEQRALIEKEYKKELRNVRIKGVLKVGKRFTGPSVGLVVGMVLSAKGFTTLKARNVALVTTLAARDKFIRFYRDNVREDLGKDADLKYARGVVGEQEITEVVKDANGNDITRTVKMPVVKNNENPWRFEFSDTWFSTYQDNSESNLFFLQCEEKWWNHESERAGDAGVSMYDILKHLGYKFEVAREGMTAEQFKNLILFLRTNGWKKGSYIDLGIYRAINEPAIRRQSDVVWIEMNCDGCFFDL